MPCKVPPPQEVMWNSKTVNELLSAAIALSTRVACGSGYKAYIHFLLFYGFISVLPVSSAPPLAEKLLVFLSLIVTNKLSFATIKLYLCGQIQQSFLFYLFTKLNAILNGVRRSQRVVPKTRLPITIYYINCVHASDTECLINSWNSC